MVSLVIEKAGVQNVFWCDVILQTQQVVAGPLRGGIGLAALPSDHREIVLYADRVREPQSPALNGTGKRKSRIPVSQMGFLLHVNAGDGIRGAEPPPVVSIGSFETKDARAGVGVARSKPPRLHFRCTRGVDIESCGQCPAHRIANFKS